MDFHSLENCIKQFVQNKVAENVILDVRSTSVSVKHRSKHGSTILAALWAKVLQHNQNFPKDKFPYKQRKDNDNERLIMCAEDVTLTIFMKNGTLFIQGRYALDWCKRRLLQIMENYNLPPGVSAGAGDRDVKYPKEEFPPDRYHHYSRYATERVSSCDNSTVQEEQSWRRQPDEENDDREQKQHRYKPGTVPLREIRPVKRREDAGDVAQGREGDQQPQDQSDDINTLISHFKVLDTEDDDVLTGDALEEQVTLAMAGGLFDGHTFIYTLWKSLLHKWFNEGYKVYIVTPFLDAKRLKDICEIFLQYKDTANFEAMYVRRQCDDKKIVTELKHEVAKSFTPKKQLLIEYQIYSKIIYPQKRFHGKFIAGVKDNEAEVMVTSANFHGNHFDVENLETVCMSTISEQDFRRKYLNVIVGQ